MARSQAVGQAVNRPHTGQAAYLLGSSVGVIDNSFECWHNRQHDSPTNYFNQEHQP